MERLIHATFLDRDTEYDEDEEDMDRTLVSEDSYDDFDSGSDQNYVTETDSGSSDGDTDTDTDTNRAQGISGWKKDSVKAGLKGFTPQEAAVGALLHPQMQHILPELDDESGEESCAHNKVEGDKAELATRNEAKSAAIAAMSKIKAGLALQQEGMETLEGAVRGTPLHELPAVLRAMREFVTGTVVLNSISIASFVNITHFHMYFTMASLV